MSATTKTGTDRLKDRERTTDIIVDVMHAEYRDMSIDTLLTRPHQAIEMATKVCRQMGRRATEDTVAEICRIALSSRKRGDLRRDRY